MATLMAEEARATRDLHRPTEPLAVRPPHFGAKAKQVIFLFMDGGPAQMDTFDPKPRLAKDHWKPIPMETPTTVFNITNKVFASPFEFKQHGQSGAWVSELFPNVATCMDDICVVRSMVAGR